MILLPMPPTTNHLFATVNRRRIPTREYKAWRVEAGYRLLAQRPEKFRGDVILNMQFGPRIRNADVSNRLKAPEDLLVEMGVIEDDRFVVSVLGAWNQSVQGCQITVTPA